MSDILSTGAHSATGFVAISVRSAPALRAGVIDSLLGTVIATSQLITASTPRFLATIEPFTSAFAEKPLGLADEPGLVGPVVRRRVSALSTLPVLRGYHDKSVSLFLKPPGKPGLPCRQ